MLTACHAGQIPGCTVRTGPRHLCRILLLRSPQATLTPEPPGPGQLAAPVTVADQRLWLAAAGRRRDEPFDDADRDLLKALAAVGSGVLSNSASISRRASSRRAGCRPRPLPPSIRPACPRTCSS